MSSGLKDSYCETEVGFGTPHTAGERTLASGDGLKLNFTDGNHFRIEIIPAPVADGDFREGTDGEFLIDHHGAVDLRGGLTFPVRFRALRLLMGK